MNAQDPHQLINRLRNEIHNLPGEQAHKDMIPFRLTASEALKKPLNYKLSAVLLLLYFEAGQAHFILTERQNYNGKHAGQISFPGGKIEESDKNTAETALRETHEEIGVHGSSVELLGRLTEVYIPVSEFLIHPYLGFTSQLPEIYADKREVKTVLHCSLNELTNEENRILTKIQTSSGIWMKDIPAFRLQEKVVWGATAIILNEFKLMLARF